jgi:membrane protein implicated in regulation of membrane protease activity
MKSNVGGMDRVLRIVLGLVLIGLTLTGNIGVWGWLGIVPLATGLLGWCPPYAMLGFSTCAVKK